MMEGFSDTPLVVASARGLREWSLTSDGWLQGSYGRIWHTAEMDADCGAITTEAGKVARRCLCGNPIPCRRCTTPQTATVSNGRCGCGIWAYWSTWCLSRTQVTGVIEATGKTITGPEGLRTAHAKILGLTIGDLPNWPFTIEYKRGGVPHLCTGDFRVPIPEDCPYTRPLDIVLAARYPGVPLYPGVADLLAAHPTTPELHQGKPARKNTKNNRLHHIVPAITGWTWVPAVTPAFAITWDSNGYFTIS